MPAAASVCFRRASRCITRATPLPKHGQGFPREARLRASHEFFAVRNRGRMVQGRYLRLSVLRDAGDLSQQTRVGIVTSRRVGGAVQRNRVRRRVRDFVRRFRAELPAGCWMVIVAKSGAAEATHAQLRDEWLRLARRLTILPVS